MGESLATFLLFVLTIHGWKDVVLVVAITCVLLYVTFAPASLLGIAVAYPIFMVIVSLLLSLGGSNIGQGAIAFLYAWVGGVGGWRVLCGMLGHRSAQRLVE